MKYNVKLSSIFVDSIKPLKTTDKKNKKNKSNIQHPAKTTNLQQTINKKKANTNIKYMKKKINNNQRNDGKTYARNIERQTASHRTKGRLETETKKDLLIIAYSIYLTKKANKPQKVNFFAKTFAFHDSVMAKREIFSGTYIIGAILCSEETKKRANKILCHVIKPLP